MVTDSASGSSSGSGVDSSIVDPAAILYKGDCDNNNNNNYRSKINDTDTFKNSDANNNYYDHNKVYNSAYNVSDGNGDADDYDDDNYGNCVDARWWWRAPASLMFQIQIKL